MSLGFFLVACLAKSAAVVLPLTLVVLDWWKKRALTQKTLLEKAPFFLISLGFGILTIYSRQFAGQLDQPAEYTLLDRGLMACHSIVFYWKKLLFPTGLSIWYPFEKTNGAWSWDYYAAPLILLGVLFAAWRSRNAWPVLWLGLLFYLSNIILSLPWATFGTFELRSDRYNYLAGIGIFAILAHLPDYLKSRKPEWSNSATMALMGLAFVWLLTSALRVRDWKDTTTLINKAIAATGDNFGKAYLWRGMAYGKSSETQAALKDFTQAIQKNPLLVEAYKFRGNIYGVMKNYQQSVDDLSKFLEKHPDEVPELYNRGLSYANLNKNAEAAADFSRAIALDSTFVRVFRARGNCYKKMGEYEKAIADLSHYLEKFPNEAGEIYNRGTCYAALGRNKEAIDDFTLSIKINPQFAEAYQARAGVYTKTGETGKADTDLQLFRSMQK
jgi:tetratricopeptide (TPR) repeat protein